MEKVLVIIQLNPKYPVWCRVAIKSQVTGQWEFNSMVRITEVLSLMEDLGFNKISKEVLVKINSRDDLFVALKNEKYRVEQVTL